MVHPAVQTLLEQWRHMYSRITNLLIGSDRLMDFVPTVVTKLVGCLTPFLDTGAKVTICKTRNSINILCHVSHYLRAEAKELVTFKREDRVLAGFEEEIIRLDLNSGVIFVMALDGIDEMIPVDSINDPPRKARDHVKTAVDAHV